MTWPNNPYSPDQPDGGPDRPPVEPPYGQPSPQAFPPPYGQQPYQQPYTSQPYGQQPYPSQPYGQQPYQPGYQQPYAQQPYQAYQPYGTPPPRQHSRALPWLITLGVLGFVALMVAVAVPVFRQNHQSCGAEHAPAGASAAAVAYVQAVNASSPEWLAMSSTIAAQGQKVRPEQMTMQLEADRKFVAALKGIQFPQAQQPAAQALISSVEQYDAFVQTASENPGYLNAHQAEDRTVNDDRAAASAELRRELRLPLSRCSYNRP